MEEGQVPLISTFRLPTQIHTRSSSAKWLDELAHSNPLWIHPSHAAELGLGMGDLVRVETDLGHFVVKAWLTEGIRPGVVACSHHMGRWRLDGHDQAGRLNTAVVALEHEGSRWALTPRRSHGAFTSADRDTSRIWWSDVGVHQNMTFGVHPDPISGQHCWHQAVRLRPAEPGDSAGDIVVDTARSTDVYREWLSRTRPAGDVSPNGDRRPQWLIRPLRPVPEAYRIGGPTARSR
ncbi:MAG: formate dehydrogenase, partial [Actinobacteria bacterium]|nr:formate dehydrogenase [Actinomycetota bacterium]